MGEIDAHMKKLLPSKFVCLVQHQAGKALSLETSSTIALLLAKIQNAYVFHSKYLIFVSFLVLIK